MWLSIFLDSHFIMKIIYLFIRLCILADGARISHHPRIFKYRKDISLWQGYLNIGFRNEKDIMLLERYDWASIEIEDNNYPYCHQSTPPLFPDFNMV